MRDCGRRCRNIAWIVYTDYRFRHLLFADSGKSPEEIERSSVSARALAECTRNSSICCGRRDLRKGLNFTFVTDVGELDLLGEVRGIGYYDQVVDGASSFSLLGHEFKVIALDKLIIAKRAAGRAKDMAAVVELEALREQQILNQTSKPDD